MPYYNDTYEQGDPLNGETVSRSAQRMSFEEDEALEDLYPDGNGVLMTDKQMPTKPKGAKDTKPRKQRTDSPKVPLEATARNEGRTEHIRVNGSVSPGVYARLMASEKATWPERIEHCVKILIATEQENASGKS